MSWRNDITKGDIIGQSTIWGTREILVATEPNMSGGFFGAILTGPDANPNALYSFNVIDAEYARKPNPNELNGFELTA